MKALVIGAGNMGSGFVKQLHAAGHKVSVASRNHEKAAALANRYPGVQALALEGAADDADAVVLATPYSEAVTALRSIGKLTGKTVIDVTNPLTPDYMGLTIGHSTSAAEEIARAVPGAHVVKAFNTLFAQVLASGPDFGNEQVVSVFVAGDSKEGKEVAAALAKSMGFAVVDAGGLQNARYLEPLAGLNIYLGYGAGQGTDIAPAWIRKV